MAQQPKQSQPPQLQIELPPALDAVYSNLVVIQHSPSEFIFDFARVLPNMPTARVGARIIMTPMHARLLLRALHENIEKYEAQFGPIYVPQEGDALASQLFGGQK
ncbi:MAG: DUF3467 domain-containing protein [Candidatus Roseilinea sp.]|uniref:DUF3467 domain-containing protein n=1 Tax=Candidatus Roseilinea sp. TaxID=2838777 RepID=UPI00404B8C16